MAVADIRRFTNRRSIIALFQQLKQRSPQQPWPLLPFLFITAPEGSGKRMLMEYLRLKECCTADGRSSQPYARLDFAQPHTGTDILSVLVALRNQLQQNGSGQIQFPRFDLGASIALTIPTDEDILLNKNPDNLARSLDQNIQHLKIIGQVGYELSGLIPFMKPIVSALKVGLTIPEVYETAVLQFWRKALNWYRTNSDDVVLKTGTDIEVLRRLQVFSGLNNPDRDTLIEDLLVRAFITDLCESMHNSQNTAVVFLGSFDRAKSGIRLLEALTKGRRSGETDPLLFVITSQQPLPGSEELRRKLRSVESQAYEDLAGKWLVCWSEHLPQDRRRLRLHHLCLPLELVPFTSSDTKDYLQLTNETSQLEAPLIDAIHEVTQGHPFYVALVADTIREAQNEGKTITANEVRRIQGPIQQKRELLLALFLTNLLDGEENDLILCAVPRMLDIGTLRATLPKLSDDMSARSHLKHYQDFSFFYTIKDGQQIALLPFVRNLLLQRLPTSNNPESDYYQVHKRLRDYFHRLVTADQDDVQAHCEEAYHALALGGVEPAISYAIKAQQENFALWEPLLQAVTQAPTEFIFSTARQQAEIALAQAKQEYSTRDCAMGIILYTSILNCMATGTREEAHIYHKLADAYYHLPGGNKQANMRRAIEYYQRALVIFNPKDSPDEWAEIENDLGNIFRTLPSGNRQENLENAIAYYQQALLVRTSEAFPRGWAETQTDLAIAYKNLSGNRQENHRTALEHCQQALRTCTPSIFPIQWARAQHRLGIIYVALSTGDHQENLRKAIEHYKAALQIRQQYPDSPDCAGTQNNLGNVYLRLEDPDKQTNLEEAISYYKTALKVFTQQAYPEEWAMVNNNLGIAYSTLPVGKKQDHIKQAIDYYEEALKEFTKEAFPSDWAETQNNLGTAYWALPGEDRRGNLLKAIACHQNALTIVTRASNDYTWAGVHHNLGNAYRDLPDNQQSNVQIAIEEHYKIALEVYRSDNHPEDWAETQTDLGIAYWMLPKGDWQTNLKNAIKCYFSALQVCTPRHYIFGWAMTQHHLGNAYRDWLSEDRQMNLQKAIRCYEAALEVHKRNTLPVDWAETQMDLGIAYQYWQEGDRQSNLQKAIACYEGALQAYQDMHFDDKAQVVKKNLADAQHELKVK